MADDKKKPKPTWDSRFSDRHILATATKIAAQAEARKGGSGKKGGR